MDSQQLPCRKVSIIRFITRCISPLVISAIVGCVFYVFSWMFIEYTWAKGERQGLEIQYITSMNNTFGPYGANAPAAGMPAIKLPFLSSDIIDEDKLRFFTPAMLTHYRYERWRIQQEVYAKALVLGFVGVLATLAVLFVRAEQAED